MIASLELEAIAPDGRRFPLTIGVGTPYLDDELMTWRCPVEVRPLHQKLIDQTGSDSLQALCLAMRLSKTLLEDFVARGGKLLMDGEVFRFEPYFGAWMETGASAPPKV
ncbi:DUF6968 family protein [Caulobacter hibisci]|uniref:DUF6968 domain-containing protein n=1 Tax=Caulobacter hibisci TaxID=2035993 RepID=A0ABS0SSG7_9CAUL|nr:hypothetical protein [Caulobacter hibisci]MBI1682508.1 hypothetical protein [Caulobacter hibisci]